MRISKSFLINGVPQWLYIHRSPKARGSLFFLHGGPGWSDAPLAHLSCKNLWNDFNVIHWDQRGTNRSFFAKLDPTTLTVNQIVEDGLEVTRLLARELGIQKPVVIGHSWGTLLGALMVKKAPELFHTFIGVGQLVSNAKSEPISLDFCRKRAVETQREDLALELSRMNQFFYKDLGLLFRQRELLFELGGEFNKAVSLAEFMEWLQLAPEECRSSIKTLYETCVFSMEQLWSEVIQVDLSVGSQSFDIPIVLAHGRSDFCTDFSTAEAWFQKVKAPKKTLVVFENSAHWPQIEENEKWSEFLLNYLPQAARPKELEQRS